MHGEQKTNPPATGTAKRREQQVNPDKTDETEYKTDYIKCDTVIHINALHLAEATSNNNGEQQIQVEKCSSLDCSAIHPPLLCALTHCTWNESMPLQ